MSIKTERLIIRAKKLIKKGEIEEARVIYKEILKDFPNNTEATKGLSSLNQEKKKSPNQEQIEQLMNFYSR